MRVTESRTVPSYTPAGLFWVPRRTERMVVATRASWRHAWRIRVDNSIATFAHHLGQDQAEKVLRLALENMAAHVRHSAALDVECTAQVAVICLTVSEVSVWKAHGSQGYGIEGARNRNPVATRNHCVIFEVDDPIPVRAQITDMDFYPTISC